MGLQDRDYWKERYDERMGVKKQPQSGEGSEKLQKMKFFKDADGSGQESYMPYEGEPQLKPNEYSFMGKFVMTLIVLLCAAMVYRYLK